MRYKTIKDAKHSWGTGVFAKNNIQSYNKHP